MLLSKSSLITVLSSLVVQAYALYIRNHQRPLENVLQNTHGSDLYTYPTDFTRGIVPKPIHSHNDYWRDVPFYSALSHGAISVEADVWLVNGTLYVGHEPSALTTARTFDALYVQPILETVRRQNPTTPFVSGTSTGNGIFDTSSGQTLYLLVDVKTAGEETWAAVLRDLAPLHDDRYLSTTDGQTLTSGPVTVVGTGNTPLQYFHPSDPASADNPRFVFYDAPLGSLDDSRYNNLTAIIAPIASANFHTQLGDVVGATLDDEQLAVIRSQIGAAKRKGMLARYWNQPEWPIGTRNAIWRILYNEGAGLLNTNDLDGAANFWNGKG